MKHMPTIDFEKNSYLSAGDDYIDDLYESYLADPASVSDEWQNYFSSLQNNTPDISHAAIRQQLRDIAETRVKSCTQLVTSVVTQSPQKQSAVDALITAYRRYGHLNATIDPLNSPIKNETRLTLAYHGLSN